MDTLNEALGAHLKDTSLIYINYDRSITERAFDKNLSQNIPTIPSEEISSLIYGLSQYLVFITYKRNEDKNRYLVAKRNFEYACKRSQIEHDIKGRSNNEILAKLYEVNPELTKLENEMNNREMTHIMSENIPESIRELINALKKELERRQFERSLPK